MDWSGLIVHGSWSNRWEPCALPFYSFLFLSSYRKISALRPIYPSNYSPLDPINTNHRYTRPFSAGVNLPHKTVAPSLRARRRENNAVGRVDGDTIDLHGQFVEEAERILEQRVRYARATGQTHLHVSLFLLIFFICMWLLLKGWGMEGCEVGCSYSIN